MEKDERMCLRDKKRIVVKIGSSSLTHPETGSLNLLKIEKLIRILCDLRGEGREVVLVSSGRLWESPTGLTAFPRNRHWPQ